MKARILLSAVAISCAPAAAWELPPDNGTMGRETIAAILAANDYPETSTYRQSIDFIDFTSLGQKFTQVVVTLTPDQPRLRNGKKIVVVGGEPGSEYAMDFLRTVEDKDGAAVWLAKRGITFVGPTRVGRWNFLATTKDGSWESVPLGQRMPIFERSQAALWTENDYTVKRAPSAGGPASGAVSRVPRPGTLLDKQLLAATGGTFIEGYRLALVKAIPDRANSLVLFWGMSTGGSTLYPLAKYYTPDGYLGWGTSTAGLAAAAGRAQTGNFTGVHEPTAARVRERGLDDFEFYTKEIDPQTRAKWWQAAQRNPRFKSTEDPPMAFGASSVAETALRLWYSDFLPEETRKRGLVAFMQDMFEPSFPPAELKNVPVLDLNGTKDEVLPPARVDANRKVMEPYTKKYRVGRIEGLHHYLFTQDSTKTVITTWMRYIDSGYFDQTR
jgi:pimeloyl-ACP methyl ester carboxylesterase